ncbi:MAG: hypothetical protein OXI59_17700 [Gemmatimonadota bacterium]|nr:hypothetical protein [Gemmatimonadota bacterium]
MSGELVTDGPLSNHVDGTPELRHGQNIQVTQFPIGRNAYVTDHAIVKPFSLSGRFICSNQINRRGKPVSLDRMRVAWETLLRLSRQRQPFKVVTALAVYDEMLFTSLERDENAETGTALIMDFSMIQIQRIDRQRSELEREGDGEPEGNGDPNNGTLNRGSQPLTNVTYDREGAIISGTIPLANVTYQKQDTVLAGTRFTIDVSWHEADAGLFWDIVLTDTTGKVTFTGKLFIGPVLPLGSYGNLRVIANANVGTNPPAPSAAGPWGTDYILRWTA